MPEQRQVAEQRQAKVLRVAVAKGSPALHKGRNIIIAVKASLASKGKSVVAKAIVTNAKAAIIKVAHAKSAKVKVAEASKPKAAAEPRGKKSPAARGRSADHHAAGVMVASRK